MVVFANPCDGSLLMQSWIGEMALEIRVDFLSRLHMLLPYDVLAVVFLLWNVHLRCCGNLFLGGSRRIWLYHAIFETFCILAASKRMLAWMLQLITNFKKCHEDHPVQKFFGACNDLKIQLDKCFREEVRKHNLTLLFDFEIFQFQGD